MSYRIEFTSSAGRIFKKFPASVQQRLVPKIDSLQDHPRPHGAEKMAGHENRYRIRIGEYRVIYLVNDALRLITVAVIGHRRDVYR